MPTPRDVLIYAVTALAIASSIASDPSVQGSATLNDLPLDAPLVVGLTITIAPQRLESSWVPVDTDVVAHLFVETAADAPPSTEDVTMTLLALLDGNARVNLATGGSVEARIDDCESTPCVRNFELVIDPPEDFVGVAQLNALAFNGVSQQIDVALTVLEPE